MYMRTGIRYAVLAMVMALGGGACFGDRTTTVDCGNGLRCPTGSSCTVDGRACTSDSCGNGVLDVEANEV